MTAAEPEPYVALALQLAARSVEGHADARASRRAILAHIAEVERRIGASVAFIRQFTGRPVRLVVLPEYLFTSFPASVRGDEFRARAVFEIDGPEYRALGEVARRLQMFLAGNAYEADPAFPAIFFQTSFIVSPEGEVVLRYRRLNSMYAVTPHDILSRYVEVHGADALFPVADTAIGRLAAIASEEILYPEIARAHALRGAELFVHSSSEVGSPMPTQKHLARRARAFENLAYVVSANTAGIAHSPLPLASADGNSAVVDWRGHVLAESNPGETMTAFAEIDIGAVRRTRRVPAMSNLLARTRTELFRDTYAGVVHPADTLLADGVVLAPGANHFEEAQRRTIAALEARGLI